MILLLCCVLISGRRHTRAWQQDGNRLVAIEKHEGQYRLCRNGRPYFIKGANITDGRYLRDIKEAGANSIRIYTTDHAAAILDSAERLGLTVTISLPMAYADKDIDYSDPKAVTAQLERLRKEVLKYKNHPALLMWGVGNETNLYMGNDFSRFFDHIRLCKAINAVAGMIHQTDPNHPAVMMVKGGSTNRFYNLLCDQVDLIGYNSFEPIEDQLKESYWDGPYIVSEFGAQGYWASPQTAWYNSIEQTSLQKTQFMQRQYRMFLADTVNCLGSYAFLWGQKQEYTSTWFSLYTDRGEPTAPIDELASLWKGAEPVYNNAIAALRIDGKPDSANVYLEAGKRYTATAILTSSPQNDARLRWQLQTDNTPSIDASLGTHTAEILSDSTLLLAKQPAADTYRFEFTAPARTGPFRLFLYFREGQHTLATANACFYVFN